jgi:Fic family protein
MESWGTVNVLSYHLPEGKIGVTMSEPETNIHLLDAAYKPFPTFGEWLSRTSVDTVRWDRYSAALRERSEASPETLRRAREIVKRAAALDTGAIEGLYEVDRGFTYTVAFETAAWEVELAKKGENVRPLFEAQLHAYDYVLDLATKAEPISEAAIRVLHEVVCRAQATYRVMTAVGPQEHELTKGRYKVLPNHVRTRDGVDHSYAPVDVTPMEMARLVSELRSEAFLAAHPVLQAAYAHYALVVIHPFADGNGRVARALASAFTYRAISMPIMVLSEHKNAYLDSLEAADRGDLKAFVDFMLARALDTIMLVKESVLAAEGPALEEGIAAINGLFVTKGGYTQEQVDNAGYQLFELIQGELQRIIAKFLGSNFRANAAPLVLRGSRIFGEPSHRLPTGDEGELRLLHFEISSSPPACARLFRNYALFVPIDAARDDEVKLVRVFEEASQIGDQMSRLNQLVGFPMRTEMAFSARLDELVPSPSGVLQLRAGLFAERVVREMLAELKPLAEKALRGEW